MTEQFIPFRELKGAEAKECADLSGILSDIKRARLFIERFETNEDVAIKAACFTAALITYRRCMKTGIRNSLTRNDVAALVEGAGEFHDYLLDQANKFVAHSVNPFEVTLIGVYVLNGEVQSAGPLNFQMAYFNPENINTWKRLLEAIIEALVVRVTTATEEITVFAKALPKDRIAALPDVKIPIAQPDDAGRKRTS